MSRLQFEVQSDDFPGHQADALLGKILFEVKRSLRDVRQLRALTMELGRYIAEDEERQAIIVLDEPVITEERLVDEWEAMKMTFRPKIFRSLKMAVYRASGVRVFGETYIDEDMSIESIIEHFRNKDSQKRKRSSDSASDILRVLLIYWMRRKGPLTAKMLGEVTGYSYPTISAALKSLASQLIRHSDRSFELKAFPRQAWSRFVSQSEKIRSSQAYTDRSGKPRSLDMLHDRLSELTRGDIAIGGIIGARHYYPGLDLVGTPRLDLIVNHVTGNEGDDFLRKLDPALVPAESGEPARVVIHSLDRPVSFFEEGRGGELYADEIECLLDLHEARLEQQAAEFLQQLIPNS